MVASSLRVAVLVLLELTFFITNCNGAGHHNGSEPRGWMDGTSDNHAKLENDAWPVEPLWIGLAVGAGVLIIVIVAVVFVSVKFFCVKQCAVREKNRTISREPKRLALQVYRADPYDVNRTMNGIPTITDIWREMQVRTANGALEDKSEPLPYKVESQ